MSGDWKKKCFFIYVASNINKTGSISISLALSQLTVDFYKINNVVM